MNLPRPVLRPVTSPRHLLDRLRPQGIRLGLERPRRLLAALGEPQTRFPAVLIAGTNGKGSTAALLDAMARAAGYATGLFTSPALERVEDQIRVGDAPVDGNELAAFLNRSVDAAREALGGDPTPFEALTAAAFLAFAEAGVDLAVIEAGMGGARDATNTARPEISLLTSVGLEHRRFLGDTREVIAREKAGVFRPGRPAVVGRLDPADTEETARVRDAIGEEATARGAELHLLEREVELTAQPTSPGSGISQSVTLITPVRSYRLDLPLAGIHQAWNLALAVRAAELLGLERLDADAIARGVAGCRLPGRLESWSLPGGRRLLLDVAHNPQAVAALVRHLEAVGEGPVDLVFGVLEDKEVEAMLPPLASRARRVVLTRPSDPRGRDPAELTEWLPAGVAAEVVPEPAEALRRLLPPGSQRESEREPATVLACGSMVLVGEVRRLLREGAPQSSGS